MSEPNINTRKNRSYSLVPYDPSWPLEFDKLNTELSPIFGDNLISFNHFGSTSIPGMIAKPTIDVCVEVKNLEEVKSMRSKFEALGYESWGDYVGTGEEYFTLNDSKGNRKYNVHTLQTGNQFIQHYIAFRDYLRTHPEKVAEYITIKEKLREEFGLEDYNSYNLTKAEKMEALKNEAKEWYKKKHNNPE